jgi:polyvinyl alcohol dehydrogenase (cytochrome)
MGWSWSSPRGPSSLVLFIALLSGNAQAGVASSDGLQSRIGYCSPDTKPFSKTSASSGWNGWGVTPGNSRFQPAAEAGLTPASVVRLQLKWAFGFDGSTLAFSQPAVSHGVLYVGSESGAVYALDAHSGCIRWLFKAQAGLRTGFVIGPDTEGRQRGGRLLYFGDQHGAVYAVDAESGELQWRAQADSHPAAMITGTPQLWEGRLFVPVTSYEENYAPDPHYPCCTFRGSIVAYEARTGKPVWRTYTIVNRPYRTGTNSAGAPLWGPSGAGVWSAPTLDPQHQILYVGTGNNYSNPVTGSSDAVLAMSMVTGHLLWSRQVTPNDAYNAACEDFRDPTHSNCPPHKGADLDFGASPILVTLADGRQILVAPQKSGVVYGLDPLKSGELIWQTRVGKGGPLGGIEWGAASDGENVYAAISDCDWKTFVRIRDGKTESYVDMDPEKGGGLIALRVRDGQKIWQARPSAACVGREHCSPAQLAAVTAIPGVIFSGSLDGHLRTYSAASGEILWDYDTSRDFPTMNAVVAHGGSLNGPGAVIVDGMVYVNSGYSRFGEASGNVLLALSPDGR